jgi:hypothetical protein
MGNPDSTPRTRDIEGELHKLCSEKMIVERELNELKSKKSICFLSHISSNLLSEACRKEICQICKSAFGWRVTQCDQCRKEEPPSDVDHNFAQRMRHYADMVKIQRQQEKEVFVVQESERILQIILDHVKKCAAGGLYYTTYSLLQFSGNVDTDYIINRLTTDFGLNCRRINIDMSLAIGWEDKA